MKTNKTIYLYTAIMCFIVMNIWWLGMIASTLSLPMFIALSCLNAFAITTMSSSLVTLGRIIQIKDDVESIPDIIAEVMNERFETR